MDRRTNRRMIHIIIYCFTFPVYTVSNTKTTPQNIFVFTRNPFAIDERHGGFAQWYVVVRFSEVNQRPVWLVLEWVTVSGRAYHFGM